MHIVSPSTAESGYSVSRAVFLWWREIWLERVSESGIAQSGQELEGVLPREVQKWSGRRPLIEAFMTAALSRTPGSLYRSLHHELSCMEGFREAIGRATFHAAQAREAHEDLVIEPVLFAL